MEGRTISHYRVLRVLGAGGMGVVYEAEDLKLHRHVALKFLPPGLTADPATIRRFHREAQAASTLNHPNICTVYDVDVADGQPFIAMELLTGKTLSHLVNGHPLPNEMLLAIATQVADALSAAHNTGVIHRDIKPGNIFVTERGDAKVLDFGLAKMTSAAAVAGADATAAVTIEGTIAGTVGYMSPEQLRGEDLDARTDLFSFGAVLYEMSTGKQPFRGPTSAAVAHAVLGESPESPLQLNPLAPAALANIISKALEKDRKLRYQSAAEMRTDLQRLSRGLQTGSVIVELPPRRRPRWKLLLAALVIIAFALVIPELCWKRDAARVGPTTIAVLPFVNISSDSAQQYFSDGLAEELMNQLSKIPGLKVTGRTSSFQFRSRDNDLKEIGDKLHVTSVLEGSVRRQGNRVRITTKLLKVDDGFDVWSESYDRELNDIFAVQAEIASAVAHALQIKLLGDQRSISPPRTADPEAYNAYLQGKFFANNRKREDLERAVTYLEQATSLDPNLSIAWAELGTAYRMQGGMGFVPPAEAYGRARAAVQKALALDPNSGQAYEALATIQREHDWDWDTASASYQKALSLAPEDPSIMQSAALMLRTLGRMDEALALSQRAVSADPLSPWAHTRLGDLYIIKGRYAEAEHEYDKVIELNPDYGIEHCNRGILYLLQGRTAQAITETQQEKVEWARLYVLAAAYHAAGRFRESDAAMAQMIKKYEYTGPFQIAEAYAYRNEPDKAFFWLDRAYERRDSGIASIKSSPLMGSIRKDPRYAAMLKKLRLPE